MKKNATAVKSAKPATSVRVATLKKAVPTKTANATPASKAGSTKTPAKIAYTETLGKKAGAKMILESKNVISVYLKKQDGTYRWVAGRVKSTTPNELGQVMFRDMVGKKDISLNLPEIKFMRSNKVTYKVGK